MATTWKALAGVVVVASLAFTACGSDEAADTGSDNSSSNSAGDGSCSLSEPVKIAELVEIKGESNVAVDDFHNGVQMAVDEINADGGICGQQIELNRIPTSALDPNLAVASILKAQEDEPDLIIGFPNSGIVSAIIGQIERAAIPTITMAGTPSGAGRLDENGSQWLWALYLPNSVGPIVDGASQFLVEDLEAPDAGILNADNPTFQASVDSFKDAIKAAGGEVSETRSYALTATDLTEQVLGLKDVDGIINWGFPNQIAVSLNQQQQNGVDLPNIGPMSVNIIVDQGLADGALSNLYGAMICNPSESDPEWSAAYTKLYPESKPFQTPAANYDAVMLFKQVVEDAGSVDHEAVREGLDNVEYSGVCSKDYFTDETGTLGHGVTIVNFADGESKTVRTFPAVPLDVPVP